MQMDIPTKSIQTAAVDALDNENTVVHVALVLGKRLTQHCIDAAKNITLAENRKAQHQPFSFNVS